MSKPPFQKNNNIPQTIEATLDAQGQLTFTKPMQLQKNQRVLITFLPEPQPPQDIAQNYQQLMEQLSYVRVGQRFNRDMLNER
ncbi:MAG: hypothetical protein AAGJ35_08585 [Myxococcota bacterium]